MPKIIHWFRQDLRLEDNSSLSEAVSQGEILPIYILDDENSENYKMGGASRVWLHHSLKKLNESLDGNLKVFSGDPSKIIQQMISEYKTESVYWNSCYEPWRIKRDKKLKEVLENQNIKVESFNGSLLWEPWQVTKDDGTAYKIFTPFYRKACEKEIFKRTITPQPNKINFLKTDIKSSIESLNLLPSKPWGKEVIYNWEVGENAAQSKLDDFLENKVGGYKEGRNFPAKNHVSNLSPHLHFGEISPNQIWCAFQDNKKDSDITNFLSEIGWREFSYYLLYHFPDLPEKNLKSNFDKFPWDDNAEILEKWQKGQTGYPIVDAGMRELYQAGTMHNRVRMVVGSFLVKNLLLHWKHGERWFWDCLLDADLASNSASWQWVAGCGTDASPYFRIFNPVTQGQKFDAQGEYTKKYVPELKNLPNKYLFNPWEAPDEILEKSNIKLGVNYPKPVVDISVSRQRALQAYNSIKNED